jgi:carboxypeptidase C (cathepsin A)
MMADSLWVFCMALNVMLVFFYQFNSHRLRKLEKYYLAFSYGTPFVPAMAYVIIDHHGRQQVLGGATVRRWSILSAAQLIEYSCGAGSIRE